MQMVTVSHTYHCLMHTMMKFQLYQSNIDEVLRFFYSTTVLLIHLCTTDEVLRIIDFLLIQFTHLSVG
jgi:hypothetical protein